MIALSKRIVTVRQKFLCAFPGWFPGPSPSSSALSMNIDHRPIYCLDCFACCRMSCDGLVSRLPFPTGFFHLAIAFDMDDLALVAHHFPALSSVLYMNSCHLIIHCKDPGLLTKPATVNMYNLSPTAIPSLLRRIPALLLCHIHSTSPPIILPIGS